MRPGRGPLNISRRFLYLAGALVAHSASATTIVPIADGPLVDRAPLVVEATVDADVSAAADPPVTQWRVTVDRLLKGSLSQSQIVVRLPGGRAADGRVLKIYGTPPLRVGAQAILLLVPRTDGKFAVSDFPQGAFVAVRTPLRRVVLRDFSRVELLGTGNQDAGRTVRDFDRFGSWIEDRARDILRAPDYVVSLQSEEVQSVSAEFTLTTSSGLHLRWFDFDRGASVAFSTAGTPLAGLASGGSGEVQRALAAWTNESATPIRLGYAGTNGGSGGLKTSDRKNTILWTDVNQEMPGTFDCSVGGTLALGGPWFNTSQTGSFGCTTFLTILEGDVVLNDGIGCKRNSSPNFSKFVEEVIGHEVGHTLGLDHSSENPNEPSSALQQALMYYRTHDDGRGARLNSDDIAGIRALYTSSDRLTGDIDDSSRVDGKDLVLLARAFGSRSGDARFSAAADLNGDGRVDGTDLAQLAANFAVTCN